MTKDRRIEIYKAIEQDVMELRVRFGDDLDAAAFVVQLSDGSMIVERGSRAPTPEVQSLIIAAMLADAAQKMIAESKGFDFGVSMGPAKREKKDGDA